MASEKTIVLITGSNSGIGFETTRMLAKLPEYHVIMAARNPTKNAEALKSIEGEGKLKGSLSLLDLDVISHSSIDAAAAKVAKDFGRIDVLINNAGIESWAPTLREQLTEILNTNTIGPALVSEAFEDLLLKSAHPRIVYITSGLGSIACQQDPNHGYSFVQAYPYRISKAGMNMLMSCSHVQLKDKGVKVHGLCPGYVHSNLRRETKPAPGTLSAETSAETILTVLEGKRDKDVGLVVHKDGVYPW